MSQVDRLGNIERKWTIYEFCVGDYKGALSAVKGHGHGERMSHEAVEVVPASALQGAVSDIESLARELHRDHRAVDSFPCGICRGVWARLGITNTPGGQ